MNITSAYIPSTLVVNIKYANIWRDHNKKHPPTETINNITKSTSLYAKCY